MADLAIWNRILSSEEIRTRAAEPWRTWRFLPLRNPDRNSLIEILTDPVYMADYANNPHDAEAVGKLMVGSLQKAIVMRYIDNLLEWGDSLFTKDSWETNILAALVFVQHGGYSVTSENLPMPKSSVSGGAMFVSNAQTNLSNMQELEQMVLPLPGAILLQHGPSDTFDSRFYTPENEELVAYWNHVADRLFKLRNCMNNALEPNSVIH